MAKNITSIDNRKQIALEGSREIIKYASGTPGVSYYDIMAYAYENDLESWISALKDRNIRRFIALYLKDKRKHDGVPYIHSYHESVLKAFDAELQWLEKHQND